MDSLRTGKRFYNVNKNFSSGQNLSSPNLHFRVSSMPQVPPIPLLAPTTDYSSYISNLKSRIQEQNLKIKELESHSPGPNPANPANPANPSNPLPGSQSSQVHSKNPFRSPSLSNFTPRAQAGHQVSNDLPLASFLSPEELIQKKKKFSQDLDEQVLEKRSQRLLAQIEKEKDLKSSLEIIKSNKIELINSRKRFDEQARNYGNDLLVQQGFRDQMTESQLIDQALYQPLVHFRNLKYASGVLNDLPRLRQDEVLPKSKNQNLLAAYSNLNAFKQPKYTKSHPKVQNSYPITGSVIN